ncbi:MAG: hypothetical protein M0006_15380 [Magnetospirillum sp.]|nr:hypothetical protein [Magnetospirillum sp.]
MGSMIPAWQVRLAVVGTLVWLLILSGADAIRRLSMDWFHNLAAGYTVGFITAFAGFVLWDMIKGNKYDYIDQDPAWRWLSYFSLGIIFVFGFLGVIANIHGRPVYDVGVLMAGIVVNQGLLPAIKAAAA